MIQVKAEIQGLADLSAKLSALGKAAGGQALRSSAMTATLPALNAIKARAPVGTRMHRTYKGRLVAPGFLARNIGRKSFLSRDRTYASVIIGPKSEAFYARFLEFGTSKIPRRPFLEPAFRSQIANMTNRLRAQLKQKIDAARTKQLAAEFVERINNE